MRYTLLAFFKVEVQHYGMGGTKEKGWAGSGTYSLGASGLRKAHFTLKSMVSKSSKKQGL